MHFHTEGVDYCLSCQVGIYSQAQVPGSTPSMPDGKVALRYALRKAEINYLTISTSLDTVPIANRPTRFNSEDRFVKWSPWAIGDNSA